MGTIATAKAVTSSGCFSKPSLLQPGNREWVTTIEAVNASRRVIPLVIIFKGKHVFEGWEADLPED